MGNEWQTIDKLTEPTPKGQRTLFWIAGDNEDAATGRAYLGHRGEIMLRLHGYAIAGTASDFPVTHFAVIETPLEAPAHD
jgi:hypothetical protein